MIIVNGSILDVAVALDPPLISNIYEKIIYDDMSEQNNMSENNFQGGIRKNVTAQYGVLYMLKYSKNT